MHKYQTTNTLFTSDIIKSIYLRSRFSSFHNYPSLLVGLAGGTPQQVGGVAVVKQVKPFPGHEFPGLKHSPAGT